ncbi:hypothetical protein ACF073_40330 [Streptomyces sp. NPDC015171]|uniref:hypothetical protein n=1 Tax=Streptomyces sp. NPDC015171 TaxID=3364945 RepID=UPI0036F61222
MTPCLRRTVRCLRPLVVLMAAALPVYGAAIAYGSTPPYTAEPGSVRPAPPEYGEQRPRPAADASPEQTSAAPADPAAQDPPAAVPIPSDSASASVHPYQPLAVVSAEPSRAGSRAGEGRLRPGRRDGAVAQVEGDDDPAPATPAAQPAEPETTVVPGASEPPGQDGLDSAAPPPQPTAQQAAQQGEEPTEPVLQILPLGSGLVLIGLGLGLALLGLRLRRN